MLKVNAKVRLPTVDKKYITLYKLELLGDNSWELSWKTKNEIKWLANEKNMYDVIWLEDGGEKLKDNINESK